MIYHEKSESYYPICSIFVSECLMEKIPISYLDDIVRFIFSNMCQAFSIYLLESALFSNAWSYLNMKSIISLISINTFEFVRWYIYYGIDKTSFIRVLKAVSMIYIWMTFQKILFLVIKCWKAQIKRQLLIQAFTLL